MDDYFSALFEILSDLAGTNRVPSPKTDLDLPKRIIPEEPRSNSIRRDHGDTRGSASVGGLGLD